jgi:hypothetical protein
MQPLTLKTKKPVTATGDREAVFEKRCPGKVGLA